MERAFMFRYVGLISLCTLILVVMLPGLRQPFIEGLDGAHHLMDGVFFYDLLRDGAWFNPVEYTFAYYRQFPALGFVFWPPAFPLVESGLFHLLGLNLRTALITVGLYGGILIASFWWLAGRWFTGSVWTWLATALFLTASVLLPYWNAVMREIPVLSMMLLWLVCWLRWQERASAGRLCWVIGVAWAVIYTKQTGALVFVAAAVQVLFTDRHLLKKISLWIGLVVFILGSVPLIIWTLTYGQANLAQSIGNDTQQIMANYQAAARGSWQAWSFYPPILLKMLPLGLWPGLLFAAGLVFTRARSRGSLLCWAWIIGFYLLFSYFDNRDARFALLALPPLMFLAVQGWQSLVQHYSFARGPVLAGLVLMLTQQIWQALHYQPLGERGLAQVVASLNLTEGQGNVVPGNVMYVGKYRQLWVYHQRMQDTARRRSILQGDDILKISHNDWPAALHNYQVQYVISELPLPLQDIAQPLPNAEFRLDKQTISLYLWQYNGPRAAVMAEIPLQSSLIK